MSAKPRKNSGTMAMVFLLMVCFIPAIAAADGRGDGRQERGFGGRGHHRAALGIWQNPQMVQDLGLTQEQVKALRDADFASREKRLELKAQQSGLRLQMEKAFSEESVDKTAVLQAAEKVADIKAKLYVSKIESRLTLTGILSAEQLNQLKLQAGNDRRQGSRHGRKRFSGSDADERPWGKKRSVMP